MESIILIFISFLTSAFNAAIGVGGGVLLIAIMTSFLPAAAIVPVHGVVQLASNASRNIFNIKHTDWSILPTFLLGAAVGTAVGSQAVIYFPTHYLPVSLGCFILLITWLPDFLNKRLLRGNFAVLGFLQGSLTLLLGATGPLNIPFLLRKDLNRDRVIATHGLLMTIIHTVKIGAFGLLGFSFGNYLPLTLGMVVAVTLGSYVGTKLRDKIPEKQSHRLFKILITTLSFAMIVKVFI